MANPRPTPPDWTFSSLLSETERRMYITDDPNYHLFRMRVDEEFLKPFLQGYEDNAAAVQKFVEDAVTELGMEEVDISSILPKRVATQTAAQFVQSQLF